MKALILLLTLTFLTEDQTNNAHKVLKALMELLTLTLLKEDHRLRGSQHTQSNKALMQLLTLTLLTEEHRLTDSQHPQSHNGTHEASDTLSPHRGAQNHRLTTLIK